jgi:membrane associated rhomboid family serine protease
MTQIKLVSTERDSSLIWRGGALLGLLGLMWLLSMASFVLPLGLPGAFGIIPRTTDGLAGIVVAPFLHGNLQHLIGNTIPLALLGALILFRGLNEFLIVLQISILVAGTGTWLFGTGGQHLGASGVVFGFTGFLLFRTVYDRSFSSAAMTVIVVAAYGGVLMSSLFPTAGVSWSGHAFGFAGGILAARFLYANETYSSRRQ